MGGENKQTTTQQSQTSPWAAAQPALQGLLGQLESQIPSASLSGNEQLALSQLQQNASAGNPFAPQIKSFADNLLSGGGANDQAGAVQSGLDQFKSQMSKFADPSYSSLNDPKLQAALAQIQSDVGNSVNGAFAAAGRDFSGANQMAYGRGVAAAQAPLILDQFNQDRALQQNAAQSLFGAQNTASGLLTGMNQQSLANQGQGVNASGAALDAQNYGPNAQLAIEAQRRGTPTQQLGLLTQIGVPIASTGSQSSGTSTTTTKQDPTRALIGGAIGGLGLLSGNFGFGGLGSMSSLFGGTPDYGQSSNMNIGSYSMPIFGRS